MADQGQRTEKPTLRRLERARHEGQFPSSREFVSALQFLGFVSLAVTFASEWMLAGMRMMRRLLANAFSPHLSPGSILLTAREIVLPEIVPLLFGGAAL